LGEAVRSSGEAHSRAVPWRRWKKHGAEQTKRGAWLIFLKPGRTWQGQSWWKVTKPAWERMG